MSLRRGNVNKRKSANSFNRNEGKRHSYNFAIMRGGWRL